MQLFLRTAGTAGGRGHRKVVLPELEKPQAGRVFDYSRVLSTHPPDGAMQILVVARVPKFVLLPQSCVFRAPHRAAAVW